MGALTSNRKRGDDYFSLSHSLLSLSSPDFDRPADSHISKKPRISLMHLSPDRIVSGIGSRIRKYPEPSQRFRREVHAPCRKPVFGSSASLCRQEARKVIEKEDGVDKMGNCASIRHEKANKPWTDPIQYSRKDKSVIDVEAGCSKNVVFEDSRNDKGINAEGKYSISDDSSIEELEIVDDGREGRSVVSDQRSRETNDDVFMHEAYAKPEDSRIKPSSSTLSDLTNSTLKVDNVGKMMESLSVYHGEEGLLGVLPHKRLLESADRRNPRLGSLDFQIKFEEKKWLSLRSRRPAKKPVEYVPREPFTSLTDEEEAEVSKAFLGSNRRKILVTHENSNIEITGELLQCLRPGAWLNDEVINVYLELLKERENREPKKFLKCHFFNTFFYKKLISGRAGYDYKAVRRWTTQRKIGYGLIDCDKIFVPIHKEIHWCLAVINKKDEKFQYLDSLKGMDTQVLKVLARYFVDEVKDKSGRDINVSSWKLEYIDDLPEQENGYDCGMFMIKYADFYSRGLGLCFNQEHMSYFRRRTVKEILKLTAE